MVTVPLVRVSLLNGSHKGHELAGDNPINVTIFDPLIELILLYIEGPEIVPLELDCILQSLQALQHSALVQTVSFTGVPIRLE